MTGLPVNRDIPRGSRVSGRIDTTQQATVYQGESVSIITILDLGLEGFGALGKQPLTVGEKIFLDLPEGNGVERYICFVSFCEEKPDGFQLGLQIVDREEEVVLIQEEEEDKQPFFNLEIDI
jgi:hypothetical protein